jgi:hypothetical protein
MIPSTEHASLGEIASLLEKAARQMPADFGGWKTRCHGQPIKSGPSARFG